MAARHARARLPRSGTGWGLKYRCATATGDHLKSAFSTWTQVLPALVMTLLLGPIEGFSWRGLALPMLQRKFPPFWAGLILGAIWVAWHIPSFLMSGAPQRAWPFGPFFLGVVAISVICTPFINASQGSLLVAILFHFQMMTPTWPDAQPWDNFLFIIAAVERENLHEAPSWATWRQIQSPTDNVKLQRGGLQYQCHR